MSDPKLPTPAPESATRVALHYSYEQDMWHLRMFLGADRPGGTDHLLYPLKWEWRPVDRRERFAPSAAFSVQPAVDSSIRGVEEILRENARLQRENDRLWDALKARFADQGALERALQSIRE